MHKVHNPNTVVKPFSRYAHGIEVAGGARWLHISGQVGVDNAGNCPPDAAGQIELAFRSVVEVLKAAGMSPANLVKTTTFLTDPAHVPLTRTARETHFGVECASTLLIVAGLARPEWVVEIEAVAAG